jgi:uncharacterized LabA/DUF88 family protein
MPIIIYRSHLKNTAMEIKKFSNNLYYIIEFKIILIIFKEDIMITKTDSQLIRTAIFYDGTFFHNTSRYFNFVHDRKRHITFNGFHDYIRHKIMSFKLASDVSLCQIVEAHFFRGRFSLGAAKTASALENDRYFDQLLMYAGIIPHYYPINEKKSPPEEQGIDVWLALEAYDLAIHKGFDVMILFAGDQDYVPLLRKTNSLGLRVMVIDIDLDFQDRFGEIRYIKTSPFLKNNAQYIASLDKDINSKKPGDDPVIDGIFNPKNFY